MVIRQRKQTLLALVIVGCMSVSGCVTSGPWIINETEKTAELVLITTEPQEDWQRRELPVGKRFNLFGEAGVPTSPIVALEISNEDSTITLPWESLLEKLSEIGRWYKAVILICSDGVQFMSTAEYRRLTCPRTTTRSK